MGMQFMVIACASGMSHFKENVSFSAKIALLVRGWGNVYICTEIVPVSRNCFCYFKINCWSIFN